MNERAASIPTNMEPGLPAPYRVEQLLHYPLAAHDDGPDALAGTVQLILKEKERAAILMPRGR
jgi:hypothetical protein